jgi:hypothetical protein
VRSWNPGGADMAKHGAPHHSVRYFLPTSGLNPKMKSFYRVRLGRDYAHTGPCFADNCIGVDYGFFGDLTGQFPDDWRSFN